VGMGAVGTGAGTEKVAVGTGVFALELGAVGLSILRQATGRAIKIIIKTKIDFFIASSVPVCS
jgi:hypothetical protein